MAETPKSLLTRWLGAHVGENTDWLNTSLSQLAKGGPERDLHIFLGLAPRKFGKADLALSDADKADADAAHPGWRPEGWSVEGAARVLGLLTYNPSRPFAEVFKDLRRTSDVAEMIALYRGLPLYPEPEALFFEVGEGLRSNLRPVFEAIAHNNPYPRDHMNEHRWNHMILKALFVGSELGPIIGLKDRANPELARILIDYAHERWAASRPVTGELWIPVRPFTDHPQIAPLITVAMAEGKLTKEALS